MFGLRPFFFFLSCFFGENYLFKLTANRAKFFGMDDVDAFLKTLIYPGNSYGAQVNPLPLQPIALLQDHTYHSMKTKFFIKHPVKSDWHPQFFPNSFHFTKEYCHASSRGWKVSCP